MQLLYTLMLQKHSENTLIQNQSIHITLNFRTHDGPRY